MTKKIKILLTGLMLVSTVSFCQAKDIEDFNDGKAWNLSRDGFHLDFKKKSEKTGISAKISWDKNHFKFFEFHRKIKKNDFLFNKELNGIVSFYVYTDFPEAVNKIGLRLIDAKGEVFQFRKDLPKEKGKWMKISFTLAPNTKAEHWGGNKDGKIDFPVSLLGISMDFNPKFAEAGSIYLDNIELTK